MVVHVISCNIANIWVKFDSKSDPGVFHSYSTNSKAFYVYNIRTQTIIEYANVIIDDLKILKNFLLKRKSLNSLRLKKSQTRDISTNDQSLLKRF